MSKKQLAIVSTGHGTLVGEADFDPMTFTGEDYPLRRCVSVNQMPGQAALSVFAFPVPAQLLPETADYTTFIPKTTVSAYTFLDLGDDSSDLVSMYLDYWSDSETDTEGESQHLLQ